MAGIFVARRLYEIQAIALWDPTGRVLHWNQANTVRNSRLFGSAEFFDHTGNVVSVWTLPFPTLEIGLDRPRFVAVLQLTHQESRRPAQPVDRRTRSRMHGPLPRLPAGSAISLLPPLLE